MIPTDSRWTKTSNTDTKADNNKMLPHDIDACLIVAGTPLTSGANVHNPGTGWRTLHGDADAWRCQQWRTYRWWHARGRNVIWPLAKDFFATFSSIFTSPLCGFYFLVRIYFFFTRFPVILHFTIRPCLVVIQWKFLQAINGRGDETGGLIQFIYVFLLQCAISVCRLTPSNLILFCC